MKSKKKSRHPGLESVIGTACRKAINDNGPSYRHTRWHFGVRAVMRSLYKNESKTGRSFLYLWTKLLNRF